VGYMYRTNAQEDHQPVDHENIPLLGLNMAR